MRIAIVNDMLMAVEAMRRVVTKSPGHQLAWVARDGVEAVERTAQDTPDLILMDLIMPQMDGVEATRRIMAEHPCPIVVVTASIEENVSKVFEAMGAGALDAVNTPILAGLGAPDGGSALLGKIDTIRKLVGDNGTRRGATPPHIVHGLEHSNRAQLVVIGASAGGPAALARVLGSLPQEFSAGIVMVQHVDPQFASGLANWLDGQSQLHVRVANPGAHVLPGIALLAGREQHLTFTSHRTVGYVNEPVECAYHPSVDVLFRSAALHWHGDVTGVILTGMGRDGAAGLKLLREQGHHTIVQDEASSAVYGMPKAAMELNAAVEALPLDRIGPRLNDLMSFCKTTR